MKPTDEDIARVRGAIYVHCHDVKAEEAAALAAWDVIAPLVLERAAQVAERWSGWLEAAHIRVLAKE